MAEGTPFVHVGLGAFARAHLATYAQELLTAGVDARVTGVSLHSRTIADALAAQGHRYTVVERDGRGGERIEPVEAVVAASTGPAAAIEVIAAPACRFVTLTVTEAGYGIVPGSTGAAARLDRDRPAVVHDLRLLAAPGRAGTTADGPDGVVPQTVPAVLAVALARRRRAGLAPPVVASLDNVAGNGAALRAVVVELASVFDGDLAAWIDAEVDFPSSVVDRIVPATPPELPTHLADRWGIVDAVPVLTEPHRSWVIESVPGFPALGAVGVEVVGDVTAHERRKLWLVNGPHSAIALAGLDRGHDTIAEAVADPVVRSLAAGVAAEAAAIAGLPSALDGEAFGVEVLGRFANPVLGHRCAQVATDSEHKLPLRIVPVVEARLADGLDARHGIEVLARFVRRAPVAIAERFRRSLPPAVATEVARSRPPE